MLTQRFRYDNSIYIVKRGDDGYGEAFDKKAKANAMLHICGGERTRIGADIRLVEILPEIVVRTTETAIENAGKGSLRPTRVGRSMLIAEAEGEE